MMGNSSDLPKGDDLNVGALLREVEAIPAPQATSAAVGRVIEPPETFLQDCTRSVLAATSSPFEPGQTVVILNDPLVVIQGVIREETGRSLGHYPQWLRFWREDLQRSLLLVLHSPNAHSEVELVAVGHPGVLNRTTLRAALRWGFYSTGWARIVARVPPEPPRKGNLADLLARCRFRHEGTARAGLPGQSDHDVWALTAVDALWVLPKSQREAGPPVRNVQPPTSRKVH